MERIVTWDWKQQPDLTKLAAAVRDVSGGKTVLREFDTGGDSYALIIADHEVSDEEARELYLS